jgi:hypothetical protein
MLPSRTAKKLASLVRAAGCSVLVLVCIALTACNQDAPPSPAPPPVVAPPPKVRSAEPVAAVPVPPPAPEATVQSTPRPANHPGEPANPAALRGVVERYFDKVGSAPSSWQDMLRAKVIASIPVGKDGKPLDYMEYRKWAAETP